MEESLLVKALGELGPWGALGAFLLYKALKDPLTNFIQNLKFYDIISFRKHKTELKALRNTMKSLEVAINKEREIGDLIDNLRDKYNFKYTYVSIYSNGESDLLGMGKYKFTIEYEKPRYSVPSIRHLYQNQSLVPYFPLISIFTKNKKGEIEDFKYKTSLLEVDLESLEQSHPLKPRLYIHNVKKMYILLLLKEVTQTNLNFHYVPVGDLTCMADNDSQLVNEAMVSDLYITQKNIIEVLNKYAQENNLNTIVKH